MIARLLRLLVASAVACPAMILVPGAAAHTGCALAAGTGRNSATLAVEHFNGAMLSVCVYFDSPNISGEDILRVSGVEFATEGYGSYGDAVCQIDHEPATYDPNNCLGTSMYWEMFVSRGGGAWSTSSLGVSSQTFADGDSEGFHYVPESGGLGPGNPPGHCAPPPSPPPPPATPARTPAPTVAPSPTVAAGSTATSPSPASPQRGTTQPTAAPSVPATSTATAPSVAVVITPAATSAEPTAGALVRSGPAPPASVPSGGSRAAWIGVAVLLAAVLGVLGVTIRARVRVDRR